MRYSGIVNFDFLTLIQILAWGEEPTGVEFFDENGNFLGKIFIAYGCLKGAIFGSYKGEKAFVELVKSQNNAGGTFHKINYLEPEEEIAAPENPRLDSLLLTVIADKETEEGQYLDSQPKFEAFRETGPRQSQYQDLPAFQSVLPGSIRATQSIHAQEIENEWNEFLLSPEMFSEQSHNILDPFALFNMESLMLYKEQQGHLIIFTENYWEKLFPDIDLDGLEGNNLQAHTCFVMAEVVRRHLRHKIPSFDTTLLTSDDLLQQVDIAISEATRDDEEIKIVSITPGETYDEEISIVNGFSETTLKDPSPHIEQIYQWVSNKLREEAAPLKYLFYPERDTVVSKEEPKEQFRIVIAATPEICQKICVNLRYYLEDSGNMCIYTITSLADFQEIERSDWEDCHVAIIERPFIQPDIYAILSHIPEKMSTLIVAGSKDYYRPYLAAPTFRERVQGIYSPENHDLAKMIVRVWEMAMQ